MIKNKKPNKKFWTLARRQYLYRIALAVAPLAILYGVATSEQMTALLTLAAALLGVTGMALANPTNEK